MASNRDDGGKLCCGDGSIGMHYWWCRKSDGIKKNEEVAIEYTVLQMLNSMYKDNELRQKFSLDTDDGKKSLAIFLKGRVAAFLNGLRQQHSPFFLQDGRDKDKKVLSYKPVRLAPDNVPLFELVLVPLVSTLGKSEETSVEFRIYESEPEPKKVSSVFAGHHSGVKKIFIAGKYDSEEKVQRKISKQQDIDIKDALKQYYWWKEHDWCSDSVPSTG